MDRNRKIINGNYSRRHKSSIPNNLFSTRVAEQHHMRLLVFSERAPNPLADDWSVEAAAFAYWAYNDNYKQDNWK